VNSVSDEAPDVEPVVETRRAVIAGHGDFAAGLISAVQQISGRGDTFLGISNSGCSSADIESTIVRALELSGASVLFTDLPAGSCTMSARRLQRSRPGLVVVTGVNLATALEFVFRSPDESAVDAATAAAEKGRATLVVHS
jgi:N-acetylgalactosamine PTS system EIIA component